MRTSDPDRTRSRAGKDRRTFLQSVGLGAAALAAGATVVDQGAVANAAVTAPVASGRAAATGSGTGAVDPRDFGAAFDGATDDSAAWQRAIDSLPNGGVIICPAGTSIAAGLRVHGGIAVRGSGGNRYAFGGVGGGTVVSHPARLPAALPVTHVRITRGGAGYSSAPAVQLSGGGGTGATAVASVSNGAVQTIRITDPGSGYTSAPTVVLSGGGGGGATATAERTSPVFFQTGARADAVSFADLTIVGHTDLPTQGIVLANAWFTRLTAVDMYFMAYEALWIIAGAGPHLADCQLFGAARVAPGKQPIGTLRIGMDCSDLLAANLEVGGEPSGARTALPNAAIYVEGSAANFTNVVAEGADIGWRITGENGRFVNCRADINHGHGWLLTRDIAGRNPARHNYVNNCWAHDNSRYSAGGYDNFAVGRTSVSNRFSMCFSDSTSTASKHRYGIRNLGSDTKVSLFDDVGASSAARSGI